MERTRVVACTGHQDLTARTRVLVGAEIGAILGDGSDLLGVCSLAAGADQVFARVVLQSGGELGVVVPSKEYRTTFNSSDDLAAYLELTAAATWVERLDYDLPSEAAYWAAGQAIVKKARELLAVWDGQPARGLGGTADVVRLATELGIPVHVVWPPGSSRC